MLHDLFSINSNLSRLLRVQLADSRGGLNRQAGGHLEPDHGPGRPASGRGWVLDGWTRECGKLSLTARLECRLLCRFLGRRVAAFELRALFAGVREAPRHEIVGAVRGWFRQSYGESASPVRASGAAERPPSLDVVLPRAGFGR